MCPLAGTYFGCECMVCHCLLIETNQGLVLVDTGLGTGNITGKRPLSKVFNSISRPRFDNTETALHQISALGFAPEDVRHIILTHLDFDHAGGLPDFPAAAIHVHAREKKVALGALSAQEKLRYRELDWAHQPDWHEYECSGERWHGFEAVRQLEGLAPDLLLIPLHGHSAGHCGVAVESENGWLLHAGDAYFHHAEIRPDERAPRAFKAFQHFMAVDNSTRLQNQQRLRDLAREPSIDIICSHDPVEFEQHTLTTA